MPWWNRAVEAIKSKSAKKETIVRTPLEECFDTLRRADRFLRDAPDDEQKTQIVKLFNEQKAVLPQLLEQALRAIPDDDFSALKTFEHQYCTEGNGNGLVYFPYVDNDDQRRLSDLFLQKELGPTLAAAYLRINNAKTTEDIEAIERELREIEEQEEGWPSTERVKKFVYSQIERRKKSPTEANVDLSPREPIASTPTPTTRVYVQDRQEMAKGKSVQKKHRGTETVSQLVEKEIFQARDVFDPQSTLVEYGRIRNMLTKGVTTLTAEEKGKLLTLLDQEERAFNPPKEDIDRMVQVSEEASDLGDLLGIYREYEHSPMRRDYLERIRKTVVGRAVTVGTTILREIPDGDTQAYRSFPHQFSMLFSKDFLSWSSNQQRDCFLMEYTLLSRIQALTDGDILKCDQLLTQYYQQESAIEQRLRNALSARIYDGAQEALDKVESEGELDQWKRIYWHSKDLKVVYESSVFRFLTEADRQKLQQELDKVSFTDQAEEEEKES